MIEPREDNLNIKLLFFAQFREATGERSREVSIVPGTDASTLLASLVRECPRLQGLASSVRFMVNGEYADKDSVLLDGDEVVFLPPIAGG